MATQTPRYGSKSDTYGREIEALIAEGMPPIQAAREIAQRYGINEGTARASLYRYRRRQGQPSTRVAAGSAPDLQHLLSELATAQRQIERITKQIAAWGQDQDKRVQERALKLIQDAMEGTK